MFPCCVGFLVLCFPLLQHSLFPALGSLVSQQPDVRALSAVVAPEPLQQAGGQRRVQACAQVLELPVPAETEVTVGVRSEGQLGLNMFSKPAIKRSSEDRLGHLLSLPYLSARLGAGSLLP